MLKFGDKKINGVILLASLISCYIAFHNHFPLVYQDTGTYIKSGFWGTVPYDRPVFYGYFIRFLSFFETVWWVVIAQSFLVCSVIYITLGLFFQSAKKNYVFIALILFLILCTGFSYQVSILIPDIFSSIAVLCLINLLLNKKMTKWQTILMSLLFTFSICTQFSNLSIMAFLFGLIVLYFIIKKIKKQHPIISLKNLLLSMGLFFSCLLIIPSVHYSIDKQFKISGSNHVFIMNHLLETGVLEDYLEKNCTSYSYKICEYKDDLGWDFIWSPESPLQKTGGWEVNRTEYKLIIKEILSTPKYVLILLQKSFEYSLKQFFSFDVTVSAPQLGGSGTLGEVKWHYKNSTREYVSSLQNQSKITTDFINTVQLITVLISLVFLFLSLISKKISQKISFELKYAVLIILTHNVISAITCSNLSCIDSRFQCRIVWMLPFFAIIVLLKLLELNKMALKKS